MGERREERNVWEIKHWIKFIEIELVFESARVSDSLRTSLPSATYYST